METHKKQIRQRMWTINLTVGWKLKDFQRSEAVTYSAKVVISRKSCKIETFLQTTCRKWPSE